MAPAITAETIAQARAIMDAQPEPKGYAVIGSGQLYLVPNTDPVLWSAAAEVKDIAAEVVPHVDAMLALMHSAKGVGLAAPQVGLGLRFFVTALPGLKVVINPRIMLEEGHRISGREGCLSWPGRSCFVARRQTIVADFSGLDGKVRTLKFTGFAARVFQHECDHLEGRNIFSHAQQPGT